MASVDVDETQEATIPPEAESQIKGWINEALTAALATHTQAMVSAITASQAQSQNTLLMRALARSAGVDVEESLPPLTDEEKQRALRLCKARWGTEPEYRDHTLINRRGQDVIVVINKKNQRCEWDCRRILREADQGISAAIA
jgi:hypothetical protein